MKKHYCTNLFSITLSLLLFLSITITAQTNVSGLISSNTTWLLTGSPYIITGNVLVNNSAVLTIEPGVVVKFNTGTSLQIDGTIIARGVSDNNIIFTSNASIPAAGDWGYVYFSDASSDAVFDVNEDYASGSILEYVIVEFGGGAQVDNNGTIRLENAHPFINHSKIRNNTMTGITGWMLSGNLRITNNLIFNNGTTNYNAGGLYLDDWSQGADVLLENNIIKGNTGQSAGGVYSNISQSIIINNNIVDSNYSAQNGAGIYFYGTGLITGNIISNNLANYGAGGGIWLLWSNATISNNVIVSNKAQGFGMGGGLYIEPTDDGSVNVFNNIFAENLSEAEGGGICVLPGYAIGTTIAITHNVFTRNIAPSSSAGLFSDSDKNLMYNTFTENKTDSFEISCAIKVNHTPLINYNNIFNNDVKDVFYNNNSQTYTIVNAKYNWWGSTNESNISSMIYDWFDNSSLGITDYSSFLTSPNTDAPVSPPTGLSVVTGDNEISLSWNPNPESDIAGYKIYWGLVSEFPSMNSADVGNVTNYNLQSLSSGKYFILVSAYDDNAAAINDDPLTVTNEKQTSGNESWFSAIVTPELISDVANDNNINPSKFVLYQNYPNPFNPSTKINFSVPEKSNVIINVYNALGEEVKEIVNKEFEAGIHNLEFNASDLTSGVYFYKLQAGSFVQTKKMILLK
ncbi:MAG: T9SS type A sorting domain-containing protein [Ignavibacteriaceae bacterium]